MHKYEKLIFGFLIPIICTLFFCWPPCSNNSNSSNNNNSNSVSNNNEATRCGTLRLCSPTTNSTNCSIGSVCATVAFMDIKSASKAHTAEHKFDDRVLTTEYYEPSSIPSTSGENSPSSISSSAQQQTAQQVSHTIAIHLFLDYSVGYEILINDRILNL